MDAQKIQRAVKLFLEGVGEDVKRPGLRDTPRRVAEMCRELFAGVGRDAAKVIKPLRSEIPPQAIGCWEHFCCASRILHILRYPLKVLLIIISRAPGTHRGIVQCMCKRQGICMVRHIKNVGPGEVI